MRGHDAIMELLLNHPNTEPNIQNHQGETPLYLACTRGDTAMIATLLLHPETDPNIATRTGSFPLEVAVKRGSRFSIDMLMQHSKIQPDIKPSIMHIAAKTGNHAVCCQLLGYPNVQLNSVDADGMTPLHIAVMNGHTDVVDELLTKCKKVDVNKPNRNKSTPLHSAIRFDHIDIVKRLIQHPNVSLTQQTVFGLNAIQLANKLHRTEIATLLSQKRFETASFFKNQPDSREQPSSARTSMLLFR